MIGAPHREWCPKGGEIDLLSQGTNVVQLKGTEHSISLLLGRSVMLKSVVRRLNTLSEVNDSITSMYCQCAFRTASSRPQIIDPNSLYSYIYRVPYLEHVKDVTRLVAYRSDVLVRHSTSLVPTSSPWACSCQLFQLTRRGRIKVGMCHSASRTSFAEEQIFRCPVSGVR